MRRTDTTLLASRNTLMMRAAADRSFLVLRILPAGFSSVSDASPRTSGMTATPVSKPDSPSASFGNRMSAITRHHRRVAMLGEQRRAPVGDDVGMPHDLARRDDQHDGVERQVRENDHDRQRDRFLKSPEKNGTQ